MVKNGNKKIVLCNFSLSIFPAIKMETTTIQLSKETRDKICSFGVKGESYDEILKRIYNLAVKEQLRNFLMSDEEFIPIEQAIKEADKRWPK